MELVIIIILVILLIYILCIRKECYTSKKEKAENITNWFNNNSNPSYEKYSKSVEGSDVLEYTDIKNMQKNGGLSPDKVEQIIS